MTLHQSWVAGRALGIRSDEAEELTLALIMLCIWQYSY